MSKSKGVGKGFGGGVETKFKEEFCEIAYRFCLLGYTNKELANFFKIHVSTIHDWIQDKPKFADALFNGREGADGKAAEGLFKRTTGFTYKEVTKEPKTVKGKEELVVIKEVTKQLPPEVGAAALWLKNRQRAKWADEKVVELKFTQELTDEELAERTKNLLEKANKEKPS